MLARANRLVRAEDYRSVVRRGRKAVGPHTVTYVRRQPDGDAVRFGFIVAKNVGGAVVRNRVRRRLKAACYLMMSEIPLGTDVVVRALPGSLDVSWTTLQAELVRGVRKGSDRQW